MSLTEATRVPLVLREEDGCLCAYLGMPSEENGAFLVINTELLNATPGAMEKFRELGVLVQREIAKRVREEVTVELLRDSMPKGPTQ